MLGFGFFELLGYDLDGRLLDFLDVVSGGIGIEVYHLLSVPEVEWLSVQEVFLNRTGKLLCVLKWVRFLATSASRHLLTLVLSPGETLDRWHETGEDSHVLHSDLADSMVSVGGDLRGLAQGLSLKDLLELFIIHGLLVVLIW